MPDSKPSAQLQANSGLRLLLWISATFPLNLLTTAILHEVIRLSEEVSFFIALVIVSLVNFVGLRHFVYRQSEGELRQQFTAFVGSTIFFRVAEYVGFLFVLNRLHWHYLLGICAVMGTSTLTKHFVYKFAIFRPSSSVVD